MYKRQVLTHAIEAYVSNMASDYTDGLAEKAGELIHKYLLRAYENGNDKDCLLYTSFSNLE